MLKVYNDTARYVNQGGGKRLGSFAIYLEPWHADVFEFLECKRPHGDENRRARDLFYALWVPDLFMERVRDNGKWSLMCPSECPGLVDAYGGEFKKLYEGYEAAGRYKRVVNARDLFNEIINSQIETGVPYMAYKDSVNNKSNQKNIGTIHSSNLCCEINIYNDTKEYSVCNLASICLPKFVEGAEFNFKKLLEVAKHLTYNLNMVIDRNYYPTPETHRSNMRHRPIGIGVQGLADAFMLLRYPYESPEAERLNREIFETIYYGALEASAELAKTHGPYETYGGSPLSEGKFQWDLAAEYDQVGPMGNSGRYDWESLRDLVKKVGVRNSLLTCVMPTASTSQIMGNYECVEVPTSNIYKRRTLAGEFPVVNKYLVHDLIRLGLWNQNMQYLIVKNNGSVQGIKEIPEELRALYKTMWEVKQKVVINMAVQRGVYIDQSQSMNLFFEKPDFNLLYNAHLYGWKMGLKTGSYYIRSKPAMDSDAITHVASVVEESDTESTCMSCSA
jgi:ribonucleoside-diphosphate reductase alpha chain